MKQKTRKVILYIAMSLDGYLAKPDGDFSFLSMVDQEGEDYGYAKFLETIDTVILGRKTYDQILSLGYELPYPDKDIYILTSSVRSDVGKVKFYSGSISQLIAGLKSKEGMHIYCDGGAETVHRLN
jgi:dihydrofolate reductase